MAIHSIPITIGSDTDIISRYIAIQNILCLMVSSKHKNDISEIKTVVNTRLRKILSLNRTTAERKAVAIRYEKTKGSLSIFSFAK